MSLSYPSQSAIDSTNPVLQRMSDFWEYAYTANQVYWADGDLDNRIFAGEVDAWNSLYPNMPIHKRNMYNINIAMSSIHMVEGRQRQHRKRIIAVPVERNDQDGADQYTKLIQNIAQHGNMYETISDAFKSALISGIAWLEPWVDYDHDPVSGDIKLSWHAYNSIIADPYLRNPDLSDCNGLWKRSFVTRPEAISLFPEYADDIDQLSPQNTRDMKFQYMPEAYGFPHKNLLTYDQFYYRTYRMQKQLMDKNTGEVMEWKSDDDDRLRDFLRAYPEIKVIKSEIPTVNVSLVLNNEPFYDGPTDLDDYPYVPVFCYFNPDTQYYSLKMQSMIRQIRDAQYLYSRRKVIELDILESRATTGWIYHEKALVDPKAVLYTGQGRGIAVKEGYQLGEALSVIPQQTVDPSLFHASEYLEKIIPRVMGINEELIGSATDDKAGVLAMLRQGAGLTTLQGLFDSLDRTQRILGKRILALIQANYVPAKIERITGQEAAEEFYTKRFRQYDIAIEDGFNTSTQKQMQFAQLIELRSLGVQIPDDLLIDAATLQNKNDLMKVVQQNQQQQQQAQQMQMQIAMQEQQARTNLANSRAIADQGLGHERESRIPENYALAQERRAQAIENIAQSQQDRFGGLLDLVKALKELESIDLKNIQDLLQLSRTMSDISLQEGDRQRGEIEQMLNRPDPNLKRMESMQEPDMGGMQGLPSLDVQQTPLQ